MILEFITSYLTKVLIPSMKRFPSSQKWSVYVYVQARVALAIRLCKFKFLAPWHHPTIFRSLNSVVQIISHSVFPHYV